MPRKLYVIFLVIFLVSILEAFLLTKYSFGVNLIIILGILLKLREIRFVLFFYLHLFLIFLSFATTLALQGKSGSAVLASINIGNIHVGTTETLAIAWVIVLLYCYSISGKEIESYFSKQILPNWLKLGGTSNIISCYFAIAVISLVVFQSASIKVKRHEITTQLDLIGSSYSVIHAHYKLSAEKYDKMTNGLIESDLLYLQNLESESGSQEKAEEIKRKIIEIQSSMKEHNKALQHAPSALDSL